MRLYIVLTLVLTSGCWSAQRATTGRHNSETRDSNVVPRVEPLPPLPPAIKYDQTAAKPKRAVEGVPTGGVKRPCYDCFGRTALSCDTCDGEGYLLRATGLQNASGQWVYNRVSCTSCEGRGRFACSTCKALGYTVERG